MSANKKPAAPPLDGCLGDAADDDLPDLSTVLWAEQIARVPVQRGRPRAASPKIPTTIRLDPAVIVAFRAEGPGWQSRINAALRRAAGLA